MGWVSSEEDVHIDQDLHEWALIQALQDQVPVLADVLYDNREESEFREGIAGQLQELMPLSLVVLLRSQANALLAAA